LLPLPHRSPLFRERPCPFPFVLGRAAQPEERSLVSESFVEGQVVSGMNRGETLTDSDRRRRGNRCPQSLSAALQLARRNNLIDQADAQSFRGGNHRAGKQQLQGGA